MGVLVRSTRALLTLVVGVLVLVPATAPTASNALPGVSSAKPVALSLKLSDRAPEAGETFTATGFVGARVKRPVKVQARTSSGWKMVASTRSTRKGSYRVSVTAPLATGPLTLRAVAPAKRVKGVKLKASTSRSAKVVVTERPSSVTARAGRSTLPAGEVVEILASVAPAVARPVELQRQDASGAWRSAGTASTTPGGASSQTHPVALGTNRYRVVAPAFAGLAAAVSAPVDVEGAPQPTPASTRIQVVVIGLPHGRAADVVLTGPGQSLAVAGDTTVETATPGEWSVAVRKVDVGTDAYHGVDAVQTVQVAAGATTSVVVDYGVVVPETTTVAKPSQIASVTDLGGGTLRVELTEGGQLAQPAVVAARHRRETRRLVREGLSASQAAADSTCKAMENGILCEGNIFVADRSASTPKGVFARVPSGGLIDSSTFLVTTRGATLTEAVKVGRTPSVDLGKKLEVTKETKNKYFSCSGTLAVDLKARADIEPTLDFTLDVAWGRLQQAQAIAKVTQTAELTASMTGDGTCESSPQELIDRTLTPVTVHLGPVPVVLVPQLHVTVDATGRASGEATVGWKEEASASFGLTYDGTSFHAKQELVPPKVTEIPPIFQGEAGARATLTAAVDVLLYGVAGPRIAAEAALTADAHARATGADGRVDWTVGYDVRAYAQFVTNKDLDAGPLGIESEKLTIWGPFTAPLLSGSTAWQPDPGYYPTIATTSVPAAEVGVAYNTVVETDDNRSGWWDLADGALPPGLTLDRDTGRVIGTPTQVGTATFTVRFTDGLGRTATSQPLTISVTAATTTVLPDGLVGFGSSTMTVEYDVALPEAAGQAGQWSVESGSLPPGLAFTSGGRLTGHPTNSGIWAFTARLDRPNGSTYHRGYRVAVIDFQLSQNCDFRPGRTYIVAAVGLHSPGLRQHAVRVELDGQVAAEGTSGPDVRIGKYWDDLPTGVAYSVDLHIDDRSFHLDAFCPTPPPWFPGRPQRGDQPAEPLGESATTMSTGPSTSPRTSRD